MRLAILHADTPYRMYKEALPFTDSALHISLDGIASFEEVTVALAFFSDDALQDGVLYDKFFDMKAHFERMLDAYPTNMRTVYAVEDARLLDGDETRLHALYDAGVRILTPLWRGHSVIGGAFDTNAPLTDFGRRALTLALSIGMIPDVSHASEASANEIFELSSARHTPVIASHSNAYDVYAHPRNLRYRHLRAVIDCGGLVGISFAPSHLCEQEAGIDDVLRHIDYYLEKGAENALTLGCDFDGIGQTPRGLSRLSDLPHLYERIKARYSKHLADKIFYDNAASFFERVL